MAKHEYSFTPFHSQVFLDVNGLVHSCNMAKHGQPYTSVSFSGVLIHTVSFTGRVDPNSFTPFHSQVFLDVNGAVHSCGMAKHGQPFGASAAGGRKAFTPERFALAEEEVQYISIYLYLSLFLYICMSIYIYISRGRPQGIHPGTLPVSRGGGAMYIYIYLRLSISTSRYRYRYKPLAAARHSPRSASH